MTTTGSKFDLLENDVEDRTPVKNRKKASSQTSSNNNNLNNKGTNNQKNNNMAGKKKDKAKGDNNGQQQPKKNQQPAEQENKKTKNGIKQNNGVNLKTKTVTFSELPPKYSSSSNADDGTFQDSKVQVFFIWFMSAIYFFAFFSFYWQIRGLYGDKGVLPLRYYAAQFSKNNRTISFDELYERSPSLVWILTNRGFTLTTSLELVTICGLIICFLQLFFKSFRSFPNYIFLYLTYFSLVKVGQTFLHFQWDTLLLETGILTVLVAFRPSQLGPFAPNPKIALWSVKWLLFKLMFSSGIVKLTSRCPLWWSLRALDVHFESQCLPTPFAWYFHQLPQNWLAISVAITYFIEIIVPFFFFVPIRGFKKFSFYSQLLFQVLIIITGNYTFFNLLTIVLCFSLLQFDNLLPKEENKKKSSIFKGSLIGAIVAGICAYMFNHYFDISFNNIDSVKSFLMVGPSSKINFTLDQFNLFLVQAIALSIWIGCSSFIYVAVTSIYSGFSREGFFSKVIQFFSNFIMVVLVGCLLGASIMPLAELDTSGSFVKTVPNSLKRLNAWTAENMMVNSYGLFRSMTGEKGRPEIIIEGANDPQNDKWLPYHFIYKPGDVRQRPRFNIPYQPRLDWQMWFAALGNYQSNPWLLNLCYRILSHEPDVLALMDMSRLPFPFKSPPKYIRISRYNYEFTKSFNDPAWWNLKTNRQAYMPVINKETLVQALKLEDLKIKVPGWIEKLSVIEKKYYKPLKEFLDGLYRGIVRQNVLLPHHIMWSVFAIAILLQMRRCHRVAQQKRLQAGL